MLSNELDLDGIPNLNMARYTRPGATVGPLREVTANPLIIVWHIVSLVLTWTEKQTNL